MTVEIEHVTAVTRAVRELIGELDADLNRGYTPEQQHGLSVDAIFEPHIRFFLAHRNGVALGCGGVAFCAGFAEVKRMYVRPEARGKGIADAIMNRLSREAVGAGHMLLRLETGIYQHSAIGFYRRAGFVPCPAFPPYANLSPAALATSVFFEKWVTP